MNINNMKEKVLSAVVIAMLGCLPSLASSSILIHLTDGTEIVCSLAKEPQMLFGEKTITLTSVKGTVGEWNFSDVESWRFSDAMDQDEVDAIDKVKDCSKIKIEDGKITVAGNNLAIFDIEGRLVTPTQKTNAGSTTVSLKGLSKGTYLLKAGNSCAKFIVK